MHILMTILAKNLFFAGKNYFCQCGFYCEKKIFSNVW